MFGSNAFDDANCCYCMKTTRRAFDSLVYYDIKFGFTEYHVNNDVNKTF